MRRSPFPPDRTAVSNFVAAVLALSDDPRKGNVKRYLEASRALEESRIAAKVSAKRAA